MENEKMQVNFAPGITEATLRVIELHEENELPNRAFFKDAQYNMELVTVLKNFKASIDSKVENSRQDNGSRTDNYSQVVNSNLPASFNLIVPIFKGRPAEEIEVEIIADVDGRNIRLSLCSPGAEVIVEEERNKAIDEQLLLIRKLAPDIAIIEQ